MKNTALEDMSQDIQHLTSPRAVFVSQHTPLCCIFHTDGQWCFNIIILKAQLINCSISSYIEEYSFVIKLINVTVLPQTVIQEYYVAILFLRK